jgi:phage terminase small subunit
MKKSPNGKKNDNRQQVFIEHYLICWNATEAARRAGYSPQTAQEQGSRLLSNVIIQNSIRERVAELKADADEVLLRLASHSRGTMEDFINKDNETIDLALARARGKLHLLKKFKVTTITSEESTRRIHEIELYDAQAATVQLAKILGQFVEKMKVTIDVHKPDSELVAELQSILDSAATATRASDSGGTAAAGTGDREANA